MENRKIEGNYIVVENETFRGMIAGSVTVKCGAKFVNHGMICKDVIIEEDGFLDNYGMVNGDVIGEGYAEIWGMVKGRVSSMLNAYIHKDAVINGKRFEVDEKSI